MHTTQAFWGLFAVPLTVTMFLLKNLTPPNRIEEGSKDEFKLQSRTRAGSSSRFLTGVFADSPISFS